MPHSSEAAVKSAKSRRRAAYLTSASIASFALTLLAAGIALLADFVPIPMATADRLSAGEFLFMMPIVALVLAVVAEASRIAFTRSKLPEPRRQQAVRWVPVERIR
jgi:hypothetical protein